MFHVSPTTLKVSDLPAIQRYDENPYVENYNTNNSFEDKGNFQQGF